MRGRHRQFPAEFLSLADSNARRLRKMMTDAEQALWRLLHDRQVDGYRFRRQVPIGRYIVDFACLDVGLVVEVDGGQHAINQDDDKVRDAWLAKEGYRVLRFWNNDVLANREGVLLTIRDALKAAEAALQVQVHPHPTLPPSRGKEPTE